MTLPAKGSSIALARPIVGLNTRQLHMCNFLYLKYWLSKLLRMQSKAEDLFGFLFKLIVSTDAFVSLLSPVNCLFKVLVLQTSIVLQVQSVLHTS